MVDLIISGLAFSQSVSKEVKYGGRIMYDMAVWGADEMDKAGTEFRRVRLFNSGEVRHPLIPLSLSYPFWHVKAYQQNYRQLH